MCVCVLEAYLHERSKALQRTEHRARFLRKINMIKYFSTGLYAMNKLRVVLRVLRSGFVYEYETSRLVELFPFV